MNKIFVIFWQKDFVFPLCRVGIFCFSRKFCIIKTPGKRLLYNFCFMEISELLQFSSWEIRGAILTICVAFIVWIFKKIWNKTHQNILEILTMIVWLFPIFFAYILFESAYTSDDISPKGFTILCFILVFFLRWYFGFVSAKIDRIVKDSITKEEKENK